MILALDTNIISYALKKKHGIDVKLVRAIDQNMPLVIPPMTYYETLRGLIAVRAGKQIQAFDDFCAAMKMPDMHRDDSY
jgi:predicted nucleic acid-binding protein